MTNIKIELPDTNPEKGVESRTLPALQLCALGIPKRELKGFLLLTKNPARFHENPEKGVES